MILNTLNLNATLVIDLVNLILYWNVLIAIQYSYVENKLTLICRDLYYPLNHRFKNVIVDTRI